MLTTVWLRPAAAQTFTLSGQNTATNVLSPVPFDGTLKIDYQFYSVPDTLDIYYEGTDVFSSGLLAQSGEFLIPYGPGSSSEITLILNQNGAVNPVSAWDLSVAIVPEPACLSITCLGLLLVALRKQWGR